MLNSTEKTWVRRGNAGSDVELAIADRAGCSVRELCAPTPCEAEDIGGLMDAADIVLDAVAEQRLITIVGDYDADGVTGTAILYLTLKWMGNVPRVRLPKRISEGYGLSEKIIDDVRTTNPNGLLITVDNGIAAKAAIDKAKAAGMTVVVLDHHIATGEIPAADAVVDQHSDVLASRGCAGTGFKEYCGAGLAYKLAEYLLSLDANADKYLPKLAALAAIGTIADVVPLHGDNRRIVKDGLAAINSGNITSGLRDVIAACDMQEITSTDIAFYLAPIINAAGRIEDDGARIPCALLASDDKSMPRTAAKLVAMNTSRKEMVKQILARVEPTISVPAPMPLCVFDENIHEGIAGIIAGKLAEKYGVPAFVLTRAEDGTWKGSARTAGNINLIAKMNAMSDAMLGYGGHEGAAGLRVDGTKAAVQAFVTAARSAFAGAPREETNVLYYDVEITSGRVRNAFDTIQMLQPVGEGCPEPMLLVRGCRASVLNNGKNALYMGTDKSHLKINCDGFSIVAFGKAQQYKDLGEPPIVDVVGRVAMNKSKWGTELQIVAEDFKTSGGIHP